MNAYFRVMAVSLVACGLMSLTTSVYGNQQTDYPTHDGALVSVTDNEFVMEGPDGKEHSHRLAADAKVTLDGKSCQLADLQPGTKIRVTTRGADNTTAMRVEAIEKNHEFASHWHDGKFVSLSGDRLVMTSKDGKEQTYSLMANAKMTLDGEPGQKEDMEPGVRIRVFTQDPFSQVAKRIEAIDNDQEFASNQHDGKVVRVANNELVFVSDDDGEEQSLSLTSGAVLTLDGDTTLVTGLQPGTRVRVTTRDAFSTEATRIEAIDKNREFTSTFSVRSND